MGKCPAWREPSNSSSRASPARLAAQQSLHGEEGSGEEQELVHSQRKQAQQEDRPSTWVVPQEASLQDGPPSSVLWPCLPSWPGQRTMLPESRHSRGSEPQGLKVPSAQVQTPGGPCSSPLSSEPVPDPPRGQPYFPLLLWLFPLLRGGDRVLGAWVRFRGLPGPLRAKLLWGSSCLSLKKNHRLGCEPGGGRGTEKGTRCTRITWVHAHLTAAVANLPRTSTARCGPGTRLLLPDHLAGRAHRTGAGVTLTRSPGVAGASPAHAASPCTAAGPPPAASGSPAPGRPCPPRKTSWQTSGGAEGRRGKE